MSDTDCVRHCLTPFECKIDFDEASAAWRANKRPVKGGGFEYRCAYIHSNGKACHYVRGSGIMTTFCKKHQRYP